MSGKSQSAIGSTMTTAQRPIEGGRGATPDGIDAVLDYFATAVIIVDHEAGVLRANDAAMRILEQQDALHISTGILLSRDEDESARIQILVTAAIFSPRFEGRSTGVVSIHRGTGVLPLQLCVMPLRSRGGAGGTAAIFILDPMQTVQLDERLVQTVYRLSQAEARIAIELIAGRSVDEIADRLCVSVHTVRTHVKSIRSKTNTRTQRDLVRLLAAGAGSLNIPYRT